VARPRLLKLLSERSALRRAVWLAGRPGTGKTTLAAQYVEVSKRRCLWYQLDAGDHDITAFFRYVLLAAKSLTRKRLALPALGGDLSSDPAAFGRALFRELFRATGRGLVVVLDNYQEVPEHAILHTVLKEIVAEIPQEGNVIVLSRSLAPVAYARNRAHGAMCELDFDTLKLTYDEALDSEAFVYRHYEMGDTFRSRRVAPDFKMPGLAGS
jgi:ATP/maltotriose-dependent transcriptional regulator MalT